jgi:hypothetical protein
MAGKEEQERSVAVVSAAFKALELQPEALPELAKALAKRMQSDQVADWIEPILGRLRES